MRVLLRAGANPDTPDKVRLTASAPRPPSRRPPSAPPPRPPLTATAHRTLHPPFPCPARAAARLDRAHARRLPRPGRLRPGARGRGRGRRLAGPGALAPRRWQWRRRRPFATAHPADSPCRVPPPPPTPAQNGESILHVIWHARGRHAHHAAPEAEQAAQARRPAACAPAAAPAARQRPSSHTLYCSAGGRRGRRFRRRAGRGAARPGVRVGCARRRSGHRSRQRGAGASACATVGTQSTFLLTPGRAFADSRRAPPAPKGGLTPLDVALAMRRLDAAALLLAFGASGSCVSSP